MRVRKVIFCSKHNDNDRQESRDKKDRCYAQTVLDSKLDSNTYNENRNLTLNEACAQNSM